MGNFFIQKAFFQQYIFSIIYHIQKKYLWRCTLKNYSVVKIDTRKTVLTSMLAMASLILLVCPDILLANNAGDVAAHIGGQTDALASMVKKVAIVIGLGLFVSSIVVFAGMKKNQTPASIPMIMLIAGIALVSISALIGVGSETIFAGGGTDLGDVGL
ncbi:MAG: hypothetical protein LC660_18735 [Desulfobacteraceae bacterium]|nr:hypothetical protein [Desulfobacteraceae bacterium]